LALTAARTGGRIDGISDRCRMCRLIAYACNETARQRSVGHIAGVMSIRREVLPLWHHTRSSWLSSAISPLTGSGLSGALPLRESSRSLHIQTDRISLSPRDS
jgi:hypothetical protein